MEKIFNKTSKVILAIIAVLTILGTSSSCLAASKAQVKLDRTSATIVVGEKITLKAEIIGANAKKETWKSSKSRVASVSSSGVVQGLKKGSATITYKAKLTTGKTVSAKCKIKVEEPKLTVKSDLFGIHENGQTNTIKDEAYKTALQFSTSVKPEEYSSQVKYEVFEKNGAKATHAKISKQGRLEIDNRLGTLKVRVSVKGIKKEFYITITPNDRYDYLPVGTKLKPKTKDVRIECSGNCFQNYGSYVKAVRPGTADVDIYGKNNSESYNVVRVFYNSPTFSRTVKTITVNGNYINLGKAVK